jgi:hypothetical protein
MIATIVKKEVWPDLPLIEWQETYRLIHLLTQIVGKIKLQFVPFKNHWWNISFLPTVRGLTTGNIPYDGGCFEMHFDFLSHEIITKLGDGRIESVKLRSDTISKYYDELRDKLQKLGIPVKIWPVPVEMDYRVPFNKDNSYREYNPNHIQKLQKILIQVNSILETFRTGFTGKASPVHFFWGAFDMAVTLFSGKSAPVHQGVPNVGKNVMAEAYNAELASFGFWPGMGFGEPAFYAYSYPEPMGYKDFKIEVHGAYYQNELHEFILPYQAIIKRDSPEKDAVNFFIGAYKATKESGNWDGKLCKY